MRRDDASTLDAAALAADYAEDLIVGTVRDVHGAVAGRFHGINDRINGGGPTVSHRLHKGISKAVYGGIKVGFQAGSSGLRAASKAGLGADIEATPRGRFVRAAVNGLIGDRLRDEGSNFAFDMGVRVGGRDIRARPPRHCCGVPRLRPTGSWSSCTASARTSPTGTGLHCPAPRRDASSRTGAATATDSSTTGGLRSTCRVNTGLPIAENGVAMAALLDRVVQAWPVDVRRLALVGHSMGGLVLRAACAVSTDSESPWTDLVTDVVCLGTPHLGAPLSGSSTGASPPSAGCRSRHRWGGSWSTGRSASSTCGTGSPGDVQNLPNARYRLVAATLTRSPQSVTAGTIGDYLVPYASALGRPTTWGGDVPWRGDPPRPTGRPLRPAQPRRHLRCHPHLVARPSRPADAGGPPADAMSDPTTDLGHRGDRRPVPRRCGGSSRIWAGCPSSARSCSRRS